MSNSIESGRRLVARMVALQAGAAVLVALLFLPVGLRSAQSAAIGGFIIAAGTALFGWRMFALGVAPTARAAGSVYVAAALKWLWVGAALGFALYGGELLPLPLLVGVVATQVAFLLGVGLFK